MQCVCCVVNWTVGAAWHCWSGQVIVCISSEGSVCPYDLPSAVPQGTSGFVMSPY